MSSIAEIACAFKERGGKRLRPRLCKAVFDCCHGVGDISPICEALENFHKASLIHDDIQDQDLTRDGEPTLWAVNGIGVAIAAGDWLIAQGYQLILTSSFTTAPEMLRAVVASHVRLCEGQGDDLLFPAAHTYQKEQEELYLSTCARKTGEAFALAAQLGALAAGATPETFSRYGLTWGILFQIKDDLRDGATNPDLLNLKNRYENEASLYCHQCALGVW